MTSYTPAEAARLSGFSIDTLRYYEREGILAPVARTVGGRRRYSDDDLGRLGFLHCLRDTGMAIAQLRRYAELSADDASLPERVALLEEHDAAVQATIDGLRRQQERLRGKLEWYRGELARTTTTTAGAAAQTGPNATGS
jgi:DNA-binding transcriptional MerR regulator